MILCQQFMTIAPSRLGTWENVWISTALIEISTRDQSGWVFVYFKNLNFFVWTVPYQFLRADIKLEGVTDELTYFKLQEVWGLILNLHDAGLYILDVLIQAIHGLSSLVDFLNQLFIEWLVLDHGAETESANLVIKLVLVKVKALASLSVKVSLVLIEELVELLEGLRLPDSLGTLFLGGFDLIAQLIKEFGAFILK